MANTEPQAPDFFASAPGYTPPQMSVSNQDQQAFQAAVAAAVQSQLSQMGVQPVAKARELTPEEAARAAVENAGAGLGIDERFAELYRHLALVLQKVGL